jgi:hypothetical protein
LKKYSQKFDEIFMFFLKSYRSGILTFCGYKVDVKFNLNSNDGKFCFRLFDNGEIKIYNLESRHPNILKSVIIGKKSWGLWVNEYSYGISEGLFTKEEVLNQFYENKILIPESFLIDFENSILKKKIKRNEKELEKIKGKW